MKRVSHFLVAAALGTMGCAEALRPPIIADTTFERGGGQVQGASVSASQAHEFAKEIWASIR